MKVLFQFKQVPGPGELPLMVLFTKDPADAEFRPATSEEANTFLQGKVLAEKEEVITRRENRAAITMLTEYKKVINKSIEAIKHCEPHEIEQTMSNFLDTPEVARAIKRFQKLLDKTRQVKF